MRPQVYRGKRHTCSILLIGNGQQCEISYDTIRHCLPSFCKYYPDILQNRIILLDQICRARSPIDQAAIGLLTRYLKEVDRSSTAVSTAISEGLEKLWKNSPHLGGNGRYSTTVIFQSLATVFDKKYCGCNTKMFREMESFFLRHALEITQGMPQALFTYIEGLDRMSLNKPQVMSMVPVLASLVQNLGLANMHSWSRAADLSCISQHHLLTLISQFRTGKIAHRPMSARQICSYPSLRSQTGPPIPGSAIDRRDLIELCLHEPQRITVQDSGPLHGQYYYFDKFSGRESEWNSDDCGSSIFDHLLVEDHPMYYPQHL